MAMALYTKVKWMILQYFIVNPIAISIETAIQIHRKNHSQDSFQFLFSLCQCLNLISVSLSIYYLFMLYEALKLPLKKYNVLPKIFTVKIILFFLFW